MSNKLCAEAMIMHRIVSSVFSEVYNIHKDLGQELCECHQFNIYESFYLVHYRRGTHNPELDRLCRYEEDKPGLKPKAILIWKWTD